MPKTAELSVKKNRCLNCRPRNCSTCWTSLTAATAPCSSSLGTDIFLSGATLAFPAIRRQPNPPPTNFHLPYTRQQKAEVDPSAKHNKSGSSCGSDPSGTTQRGNRTSFILSMQARMPANFSLVSAGTGSSHSIFRPSSDESSRIISFSRIRKTQTRPKISYWPRTILHTVLLVMTAGSSWTISPSSRSGSTLRPFFLALTFTFTSTYSSSFVSSQPRPSTFLCSPSSL